MSKIPSLSSDWEEFKSHVYGFVVDVASETNTKAALLSAVKKEFGTPEEVAKQWKDLELVSAYRRNSDQVTRYLPLVTSLSCIALAMFTPFHYAPIGLLFLFISLYAVLTKHPFLFSYYKKRPSKVYKKGPFWVYTSFCVSLGLAFFYMEWWLP
ncbi:MULTISPECIES: hypothetical protein [Pontibacillus]|uniref:Uncharacterized protein n=1 Tax=Pontibacillus chungwhensis TaxID=265426 RepID=A0ABY8UTF6_9BACI|nr:MULTISPECIES: hypothetical protein [Pontibacillus]WIF96784.1 hypothetical protein QNI29_13610 [Pontibacillus chungwhensis]